MLFIRRHIWLSRVDSFDSAMLRGWVIKIVPCARVINGCHCEDTHLFRPWLMSSFVPILWTGSDVVVQDWIIEPSHSHESIEVVKLVIGILIVHTGRGRCVLFPYSFLTWIG